MEFIKNWNEKRSRHIQLKFFSDPYYGDECEREREEGGTRENESETAKTKFPRENENHLDEHYIENARFIEPGRRKFPSRYKRNQKKKCTQI